MVSCKKRPCQGSVLVFVALVDISYGISLTDTNFIIVTAPELCYIIPELHLEEDNE